mmetsp:Transcript_25937/g.60554  ORF Transcript_25937/g.60554 Transcript_25937/m.60554 type:complete len:231 (+) Transcript_25937:185-877(+)
MKFFARWAVRCGKLGSLDPSVIAAWHGPNMVVDVDSSVRFILGTCYVEWCTDQNGAVGDGNGITKLGIVIGIGSSENAGFRPIAHPVLGEDVHPATNISSVGLSPNGPTDDRAAINGKAAPELISFDSVRCLEFGLLLPYSRLAVLADRAFEYVHSTPGIAMKGRRYGNSAARHGYQRTEHVLLGVGGRYQHVLLPPRIRLGVSAVDIDHANSGKTAVVREGRDGHHVPR